MFTSASKLLINNHFFWTLYKSRPKFDEGYKHYNSTCTAFLLCNHEPASVNNDINRLLKISTAHTDPEIRDPLTLELDEESRRLIRLFSPD